MVSVEYSNQSCANRELILGCLRLEDDAQKTIRLSKYRPNDWEDVFQQAESNGLQAYLFWRLKPILDDVCMPGAHTRPIAHSER